MKLSQLLQSLPTSTCETHIDYRKKRLTFQKVASSLENTGETDTGLLFKAFFESPPLNNGFTLQSLICQDYTNLKWQINNSCHHPWPLILEFLHIIINSNTYDQTLQLYIFVQVLNNAPNLKRYHRRQNKQWVIPKVALL